VRDIIECFENGLAREEVLSKILQKSSELKVCSIDACNLEKFSESKLSSKEYFCIIVNFTEKASKLLAEQFLKKHFEYIIAKKDNKIVPNSPTGVKFSANVALKCKYKRDLDDTLKALTFGEKQEGSKTIAPFIPFSQRQSKAVVASHASLKKVSVASPEKMSISKADKLIENAMKDYNQFYRKHIPESKW
jgi:hypothetical protein